MSEYYEYLIYAAYVPVVIICLMMSTLFVSLLASIKIGFSGKFILHKKHPIYLMRYIMMFPQALFLSIFFKDNLKKSVKYYINGEWASYRLSRWQITKNLCHDYVLRELNLCKIFWSQLISIVVFLPINLAFIAIAIPLFIIVTPPALVVFLVWKAFILGVIPVIILVSVFIAGVFQKVFSHFEKIQMEKTSQKLSNLNEEEKLVYRFGNNSFNWKDIRLAYCGLIEFTEFLKEFKISGREHKYPIVEFFKRFQFIKNNYSLEFINNYLEELLGEKDYIEFKNCFKYYDAYRILGEEEFLEDSYKILIKLTRSHKKRKSQLSESLKGMKEKKEENERIEEARRQRAIEREERWTKRWEFFRDVIYRRILCPTFEYVEKDKNDV